LPAGLDFYKISRGFVKQKQATEQQHQITPTDALTNREEVGGQSHFTQLNVKSSIKRDTMAKP
jgi:hypothetical protein